MIDISKMLLLAAIKYRILSFCYSTKNETKRVRNRIYFSYRTTI